MSKLVVTNIRLSKAELQRYRELAQAAGMSLSQLIRAVVGQYTHQKLVSGKADVDQIAVQQQREAEPIVQLLPPHERTSTHAPCRLSSPSISHTDFVGHNHTKHPLAGSGFFLQKLTIRSSVSA